MQKTLFISTILAGLSWNNAFAAQSDAYDHFNCAKQSDSQRQQCDIVQSVTFETDASTKVDYENEWKIRVKAPCGTSKTVTGIFITADAAIGGHTISLGGNEDITLIGSGPVILSDRSPQLTRFWTFEKSCRLSFELLSREISVGQKATWTKAADVLASELQSYMKIINRRTSVLGYLDKRDSGDQSIYGTLENLIEFYKSRDDMASEFMVRKLVEVRDGVPKADIESDFQETAKTALLALTEAKKYRDRMTSHGVEVSTTLTDAISKAEKMFKGDIHE